MNQCVVVCYIVICYGMCLGLPSPAMQISNLKFSLWSLRNNTGQWIAKVLVGHDADDKDVDPIAVTVDQEVKKFEDHEEIFINITARSPPNITEVFSELEQAAQKKPTKLPTPGYKLIKGLGYYKIYPTGKAYSWKRAAEICEEDRGYLLVLNSVIEAGAIDDLISKSQTPHHWFWIGFHDQYVEGRYVTVFNKSLVDTGYKKWAPGEPLVGSKDDCGFYKGNWGLGIGYCSYSQSIWGNDPFICEQDP